MLRVMWGFLHHFDKQLAQASWSSSSRLVTMRCSYTRCSQFASLAARVKLPSRATARKVFNWCGCGAQAFRLTRRWCLLLMQFQSRCFLAPIEITTSSRCQMSLGDGVLHRSCKPGAPGGAEIPAPSADRFTANSHTAFQQHFLDHPPAERKPAIISRGKRWFL